MRKMCFVYIGIIALSFFVADINAAPNDDSKDAVKAISDGDDEEEEEEEEEDEKEDEKADEKKNEDIPSEKKPKKKQVMAKGAPPVTKAKGTPTTKNKGKREELRISKAIIREIEINSVNFIKLNEKIKEIFIPDPTVLDVQMLNDNSLYVIGLAAGVTSLVINSRDGRALVDCKVRVTYPLETIKEAISEMYPDTSVELMSIDSSLIVKGRVPSPETASDVMEIVGRFVDKAKVVNKLTIETSTQVLLKVKIAEVTRELTKSLGINWRAISASKDVAGTSYGFVAGDSSAFLGTAATGEEMAKEGGLLATNIKGGRWVAHVGGKSGLSGLLDALANESFASILAEPTLVAMSGTSATFQSGGEQGYLVTQPNGGAATTEFKTWGTSIDFTPVVISEDRITIKVTPKVSTVAPGSTGIPALTTKEVSTTVELGSGESLAIAGLLQTTQNSTSSETPFLADLPLFGSLFRQNAVQKTEKELVIIVTPYIVKPSSKKLKTPVEMAPRLYSPLESILTRKFHKNRKKGRSSAGVSVKGSGAGFSLR